MRFKLGLALGFAAGYWFGTTPADQRRTKLDEMWSGVRENPRLQRVSDTVTKDAHRLGDAVEHRLVRAADGAVGAIAGSVEPGNGSAAEPSAPPSPQAGSL